MEGNRLWELWLREAGQEPLLTAEEEVALATRAQAGEDAARDRLVAANLRLVISIVKHYRNSSLELMDLVQAGNEGLLKAVDEYDPRRGFRFSTYAYWWIRQGVTRLIQNQTGAVRIPVHVRDVLPQFLHAVALERQRLEREPTAAEIGAALGWPPSRVACALAALQHAQIESLESTVVEDVTYAEALADREAASPESLALANLSAADVDRVLAGLPQRLAYVLRRRLGLEDGVTRSLEEVGEEVGVSRERIRQLQRDAMNRLRARYCRACETWWPGPACTHHTEAVA